MGWLLHRSVYRYFLVFIIFLFFLNIVLISHIVDLQILIHNLLYERKWSTTLVPQGQSLSLDLSHVVPIADCNIADATAVDALSRMRTDQCRIIARELICSSESEKPIPLPNSCPKFDHRAKGDLVGCFYDSKSSRTLSGHSYKFVKENCPQYCVNACIRAGFKYAGIEYQNECHCGDELVNATELGLTACRVYPCPSLNATFCGGYEAVLVYFTGIREKPTRVVNYVEPPVSIRNEVQILFLLQLNGRNSRQIHRLLRVIYSPKHLYLIHVDKRQNYMFEEMLRLEKLLLDLGFQNFYVLRDRYATIWGASNLLTMVLESVKKAFHKLGWTEWHFLLNMSESDFPILSLSELEFHLARNKNLSFLSSHGQNTGRFIQKQGLDFMFLQCENRMWRLKKRTNFPQNIRLDGGSDWVVLSREFLNFSISDAVLPKKLRDIYATVLLPVESFFHTLAYNTYFCDRTAKGNLRITNWKRKQGCRCAMLKNIVDWCGCSPLVFTKEDAVKFHEQVAKKRPAFFARKFDGLVSQAAIALAERRALKDREDLIPPNSASKAKTWVNYYMSTTDQSDSVLLNAWSHALYLSSRVIAEVGACTFTKLVSLFAYKANDHSPIKTIVEVQLLCNSRKERSIQLLVDQRRMFSLINTSSVEDFLLSDIRVGSNRDLKEDSFRNYAGVLSEGNEAVVQLWWKRDKKSLELSLNSTSPRLKVSFLNLRGRKISFEVSPYDSIRGAQYALLPLNETLPGEWRFLVESFLENNVTSLIASTKFVIFPKNAHFVSSHLVNRYFEVLAVCSKEKTRTLPLCRETIWSHNFPDPKSVFPVKQS